MDDEKVGLVFQPFEEDLELQIAEKEDNRCLYPPTLDNICVSESALYSIREMKNYLLILFIQTKLQVAW